MAGRAGEISGAPGGKAFFIRRDPVAHVLAFARHAEQLINLQAAGTAIYREPVKFAHDDTVAAEAPCLRADDDGGAVALVGAFQPAGDVHGIADHRVVQPNLRTDIADQHVAGIDADADFYFLAMVIDETRLLHRTLASERRAAAIDGVVGIGRRRAPERHHGIADELVDGAAAALDLRRHHVEIAR